MNFRFPANTAAPGVSPAFSANALALILEAEGVDQPAKWPGASSGITLGRGYDLSAESTRELQRDWAPYLSAAELKLLLTAAGLSGTKAAKLASRFKNIRITAQAADAVFYKATLPKYISMTRLTFPCFDALPLDAQGALVSLIYNRGTDMGKPGTPSFERRKEMRAIFAVLSDGVQKGDLKKMAEQLRAMKRLWAGQGVDGLVKRREAEACMVEQAG